MADPSPVVTFDVYVDGSLFSDGYSDYASATTAANAKIAGFTPAPTGAVGAPAHSVQIKRHTVTLTTVLNHSVGDPAT